MSAKYAVIVCFTVKPASRMEFMVLLRDNARASLDSEPDCSRFDIVEPPQRAEEVWLYEIYTDRAAFDAHLGAAYFLAFDAETREMIATKTVIVGPLESPEI